MPNGLPEGFEAMMRAGELQRREARRRLLMTEANRVDQPPAEEVERAALKRIQDQHEQFLANSVSHFPSKLYWVRLWKALRGAP